MASFIDLCQSDYATVYPDRYFPETFRDGTCSACGEQTFVGRSSLSDLVAVGLTARWAEAPYAEPLSNERDSVGRIIPNTVVESEMSAYFRRREQEDGGTHSLSTGIAHND